MTIARDLGFECALDNLARSDLYIADEMFVCGTAAEVSAVNSVDDREIPCPGPMTTAIADGVPQGRARADRPLQGLGRTCPRVTGAGTGRDRAVIRDPGCPSPSRSTTRRCATASQLEGISLTVDDKLRIAEQLDYLGVHYIEGGWPGANPKDDEFFRARRDRAAT